MSEIDKAAEHIVAIDELIQVEEMLDNADVSWTLSKIAHIVTKPDIPSERAIPLMLKLQALAMQFKIKSKYYMYEGKTEKNANVKKNYYMTLADEIDKLVSVLKYITKIY
ncbi:hypothetical protein PBI_GRAYSON_108 [Rhodococcus phage Grayson]|nr:hypothetical protein PBI_GRAYSON_108 [Rhodococcus phage Grayson]